MTWPSIRMTIGRYIFYGTTRVNHLEFQKIDLLRILGIPWPSRRNPSQLPISERINQICIVICIEIFQSSRMRKSFCSHSAGPTLDSNQQRLRRLQNTPRPSEGLHLLVLIMIFISFLPGLLPVADLSVNRSLATVGLRSESARWPSRSLCPTLFFCCSFTSSEDLSNDHWSQRLSIRLIFFLVLLGVLRCCCSPGSVADLLGLFVYLVSHRFPRAIPFQMKFYFVEKSPLAPLSPSPQIGRHLWSVMNHYHTF